MAGRKRVRELCSSGRRTLCATLCGADHHHCAAWKHARVLIVARLQLRQVRRQGGGPLGSPEQARERESASVRSPNSTRVRGKARQPVHVCPPRLVPTRNDARLPGLMEPANRHNDVLGADPLGGLRRALRRCRGARRLRELELRHPTAPATCDTHHAAATPHRQGVLVGKLPRCIMMGSGGVRVMQPRRGEQE